MCISLVYIHTEYFLNYWITYGSMYVTCATKHIPPCKRSATQLGAIYPLSYRTQVPRFSHNSPPLDSRITNEIYPASSQWCLSSNLAKQAYLHIESRMPYHTTKRVSRLVTLHNFYIFGLFFRSDVTVCVNDCPLYNDTLSTKNN